jgi:hypothetical protein
LQGEEVTKMAKVNVGGFSENDFGKALTVIAALIAVGLLPKKWQKGVAIASAGLILLKLL